jgi:hypothetical protein
MAEWPSTDPPPQSAIGRYTITLDLLPEPTEPRWGTEIPAGFAGELGPDAFAVEVRGDHLAGHNPPIRAGDLVWIDHPRHREPREGRPHVALVLRSLEEDEVPSLALGLWRGGRLYHVRPNHPGPPVESEVVVAWIYAVTPIIAVPSCWAPLALRP